MKRLITTLAGGLILMGLTANAQYPLRYEPRYRDNGYRDEERDRERARFFDQVKADLERAQATAVPFTGDGTRILRAQEQVNAIQNRLSEGVYDRRGIDESIEALQRVVNGNHIMSDVNRDALANDLTRLQAFRDRIDQWQ
jgi:hypothetical protein